jgi:hypothetical protein
VPRTPSFLILKILRFNNQRSKRQERVETKKEKVRIGLKPIWKTFGMNFMAVLGRLKKVKT